MFAKQLIKNLHTQGIFFVTEISTMEEYKSTLISI